MRTSKEDLSRATCRKNVSHHCLSLAETQRQAEDLESFILKKREGFRCAFIGGCLYRETVGGLTRSGAFYVIG